jgi:hypothetical protein
MRVRRFAFEFEVLHNLYVTRRLSTYRIAGLFGCSDATVSRALKRHGIETRPLGTARRPTCASAGCLNRPAKGSRDLCKLHAAEKRRKVADAIRARRREANKTPAQRSEAIRKAWETRRARAVGPPMTDAAGMAMEGRA